MKKVLITGGTGMLGASLISHLRRAGFHTVVQGYKQKANINIDMTDKKQAIEALKDLNPDIIINLICLSINARGFLIYLFQIMLLEITLIFIISAFFLISPNNF